MLKQLLLGVAVAGLLASQALAQAGSAIQYTPGAGGQLGGQACGTVGGNPAVCQTQDTVCTHSISETVSAASQVIFTPTNKAHFCVEFINSQGQQNVSLVEGAPGTCTSPRAILGDVTASATTGLQLFAGQAYSVFSGIPADQTQTAGNSVCLLIYSSTTIAPVTLKLGWGDY